MAGTALVAAAIALVGTYAVLQIQNQGGDQIQSQGGAPQVLTVPGVVGLPEAEAVQTIERLGLQAIVERDSSNEVPAGLVVGQSPLAGAQLDEGQAVTITVSTGAEPLEVPQVVGLGAEDAIEVIVAAGFVAETVESPAQEPIGVVISQDPGPGELAKEGSSVTITVSTGAEVFPVPDVVGQDEATARVMLENAGFAVSVVTAPAESQAGLVTGQTPSAGGELVNGATVTLTVSTGPATVAVPSVTGQTRRAAERTLRAAGFAVEVVGQETSGSNLAGIVLSQDPRPGVRVEPATRIVIVVGIFVEPVPENPPAGE